MVLFKNGLKWGRYRLTKLPRFEPQQETLLALEPFQERFHWRDHLGRLFRGQMAQDFLAYILFGRNGFFVEFGASDGDVLSNSRALEALGWKGILAEPGRQWHDLLKANRPSSMLSFDCVWSDTGSSVTFYEMDNLHLSNTQGQSNSPNRSQQTKNRVTSSYQVQTVCLHDLLTQFGAPEFVEYISMDTEGSEFQILEAFPFDKWTFGLLTVEHNFSLERQHICDLLQGHGYVRVLMEKSGVDDWYVHSSILETSQFKNAEALFNLI
jgi:FkbM family methyltransferase